MLASKESALRSLDELYVATRRYGSSREYKEFLDFVVRFPWYSPYNAMLVHIQKPGSEFVLTGSKWWSQYARRVKPGAQPLVILQPMGPVMFVFDVSDTEGEPLPKQVDSPFLIAEGRVGKRLDRLISNCTRDGVRVSHASQGSQGAGAIGVRRLSSLSGESAKLKGAPPPICYEIVLNESHSPEIRFATLAHELGHLYCGHVGTLNPAWWPDRQGGSKQVREFEAESISYLVCGRLGLKTPSEGYLHSCLEEEDSIPPISLDRVLTAAGLVQEMATKKMKPRQSSE